MTSLEKAIQARKERLKDAPRAQCPRCLHWVGTNDYSPAKDLCDSCIEDDSAEDMENWLRADYNSSRGV